MSNKRSKKKKKAQKAIGAPQGIAVPESIAEEIRGTLIGRLQLNLWEVITGQKNLAPIYKQILRYLRKTSLRSASIGEMEHAIFYGKKFFTTFEALTAVNVATLLEQLEDEPWPQSRYLELSECPAPLPATLGVVVSNGTLLLPGGGRVYVVSFLNEAYPQRLWARMEVRASRANPDHTFSKRTQEGWKVCDPSTDPLIQLAVCCLQALKTATPPDALKYVPVGAEPPEPLAPEPETPADPEYDRRLALVYAGKMPCALVRVPLADVRPYRAEFVFEIPQMVVDRMAVELRDGASAPMLLYWKAPSFIVSDDYAL